MEPAPISRAWSYFLVMLILVHTVVPQSCVPGTAVPAPFKVALHDVGLADSNYFYIGGIFGVHSAGESPFECGKVRERGIQNIEAFLWAVKNFRDRYPNLLPNIRVGALAFDTCSSPYQAVQQVLNLENCYVPFGSSDISPSSVLAFVGPDRSSEARELAPLMRQMKKVLVSHAATSASLSGGSDSDYEYFLRTVPSDAEQVNVMISILKKENWKFVQLLHSDNAYGVTGMEAFREAAEEAGICIVFTAAIPESASEAYMDSLVKNLTDNVQTRVVVVFANDANAHELLVAGRRQGVAGLFTWLGTNSWGTSEIVPRDAEEVSQGAVTLGVDKTGNGVGAFQQYYRQLTPNANTDNPWFNEYWTERFHCDLAGGNTVYGRACDVSRDNLNGVTIDEYVPYTIKAVDAILHGIEKARSSQCNNNDLCSGFINNAGKWDIIHTNILKINLAGEVEFDQQTGDAGINRFQIYNYRGPHDNCATYCYNQIGFYYSEDPSAQPRFTDSIYSYDADGNGLMNPNTTCPSNPCSQCDVSQMTNVTVEQVASTTEKYDDLMSAAPPDEGPPSKLRDGAWVIVLLVLSGLGILLLIIMEIYLMSKILATPYVKHWRTMWLGQMLLLGAFLLYLTSFAFVPTPTKATCGIIRFGVGVSYAMCFAVMLVKLLIILSSKSVGYLKGIFQVLMFIFAWGVQIVVDVEWLILRKPDAVLIAPGEWVCNVDFLDHIKSLVYVMFLIVITVIISVKTHGIITNHREGIFIGLVSGFSVAIWIAWILLGALSNNRHFEDPCLAFGMVLTATLILFVMFLPKVRQLNTMGVEGIYAEDVDAASVISPSVVPPSVAAGSVVYGPPSYHSKPPGPIVYVNGGVFGEPVQMKTSHLHVETDPRERLSPANPSPSVRSAPAGTFLVRRPGIDSAYASTRVLRVTPDLAGRSYTPAIQDYPVYTNTVPLSLASNYSGTLKKPHSLQDLGSL